MLAFDLRFAGWPDDPSEAAAYFYREQVAGIREPLDSDAEFWSGMSPGPAALDCAAIIFPAADHTHRGWRLAAIQSLARELAPCRVNGIAGSDDDAIQRTVEYLASAPGITGQLLEVDGFSAKSD